VDVEYRNPLVWLRYAEFEMRVKNINAARNVWDRAVTLLPRVDQFWLKYSYMEDIIGTGKNDY
jgi:crooked neck